VTVEDNRGHADLPPHLCGADFVIVIPPGEPEIEQDKLCGDCAKLPPPPPEQPGTSIGPSASV
jgi:hypothetical protein